MPEPLNYGTPPAPRRGVSTRLLLLGVCTAVAIGTAWFFAADFQAYIVDSAGAQRPKFELPLAWQIAESTIVGVAGAAVVVVGLWWARVRSGAR